MEEKSSVQFVPKVRINRRMLYWAAFFIVLIILGLFLWRLSQRPSVGTVTVVPKEEKIDQLDPAHRKRYQGKYLTFTYPYDFQRREEVEAVKHPLLERVYISRSDIEGRKIALTLQDNAGNTFEEYSSFRIRQNDSDTYREEQIERNGLNAVLFTKSSSVFEVGAFFHRGNQVASLVVSSPTTEKGLRDEVIALLDSFAWKEGENDPR